MRLTSYKLLSDFEEHKLFVNLRLKNLNIPSEQIKQVTIRIYGILQHYDYLNFLVEQTTKDKKIDQQTKRILILSIYEYLYLDSVPEYAIIAEYTKLAKKVHHKSAKYVSYYLNNELSKTKSILPSYANDIKNESIIYSHPLWLVKRLKKQYPEQYIDILKANQRIKKISARVINDLEQPELFENFMFDDLVQTKKGNILQTEDFKNQNIIIQDLGSYLVGKMINANSNDNILDLCAAPGNKTMHIAANANLVVANELNQSRFELLKQNLVDKKIDNVICINCNATDYQQILEELTSNGLEQKYSKILLDVPCSGWGVFGSKPESKYYQDRNEIENILKVQAEILKTANNFLTDNGEIVYSTCTINQEENEIQVEKFMQEFDFCEIKEQAVKDFYQENKTGITLLPQDYHTDGFYMCKMKRNK